MPNSDILNNNANPFTVPDGYFDTLQERIMSRIQAGESRPAAKRMWPYRALVAAAACILFILSCTVLYMAYTGNKPAVAESAIDEEFYQWFYASDRSTLMAESLNTNIPDNLPASENSNYEEDEAIIRFLERDNINVVAIVQSLNNE